MRLLDPAACQCHTILLVSLKRIRNLVSQMVEDLECHSNCCPVKENLEFGIANEGGFGMPT